jgi:hypothetical protein
MTRQRLRRETSTVDVLGDGNDHLKTLYLGKGLARWSGEERRVKMMKNPFQ